MTQATPEMTSVSTVQAKLLRAKEQLNAVFLQREVPIDLLFTAPLGGTNMYLGGPPGTGKTHMINTLSKMLGLKYGYALMGADVTPDMFIGGIDLLALQQGKFTRDLSGGLADVGIFASDETFKSNTPALNSMLGILNEKAYRNGKEEIKVPLQLFVGMSNELPEDEGLEAFWDRLTLRYWVDYLGRDDRTKLMLRISGNEPTPEITEHITEDEIQEMRREAAGFQLSPSIIDLIQDAYDRIKKEIKVSDRKFGQIVNLLKFYAYVKGEAQVKQEHLDLLVWTFWSQLSHIPTITAAVKDVIGTFVAEQEVIKKEIAAITKVIQTMAKSKSHTPEQMKNLAAQVATLRSIHEKVNKA